MLRNLSFSFRNMFFTQTREKGHLNRPHLRKPFWLIRKSRTIHEDDISTENKSFVKEVIHDAYDESRNGRKIVSMSNLSIKTDDSKDNEQQLQSGRRCGLIARKIGQYPLWLKNGEKIRTTLLQVVDNHVIKYTPPGEYKPAHTPNVAKLQKYGCIIVGAESVDPSLFTKDYSNLFRESGLMPKRNLARFIVSPTAAIAPGTQLNATHFRVGDFVDVRGKTVDHGFQGVVKRHNFKGMPASHGVTKTHRRPGNIGGGGEKGRVWPGTKLPGHMGNRWRIIKGLRIWRINTKYNVIWVQGSSVPGSTNGLVYIYDSILPLRRNKNRLQGIDDDRTDIWFENVHDFKSGTIVFDSANSK